MSLLKTGILLVLGVVIVAAKSRYDVLVPDFEELAKNRTDKYFDGLDKKQRDLLVELVMADEAKPTPKAVEATQDPAVFKKAVRLSADLLLEHKVDRKLVEFIVEMLHQTNNNTQFADEDEQIQNELYVIGKILAKYDVLGEKEKKLADQIFPDYANAMYHVPQLREWSKAPEKHSIAYFRFKNQLQG
ncbi:unnamed protein product [Bursaphelenchus xylophilus]|uniref:(pine wood nematode) hypothetical protein n=1 Tax=Bursaphelenchus xylophilus TaxID=6326 RepID=A0A1I7SKX4_BURXY|nr:unnamed protein product [Bursaphelenchus xylophilus]CAG9129281.1 unnamed protein product [Bursaphelenchus xylophilus]